MTQSTAPPNLNQPLLEEKLCRRIVEAEPFASDRVSDAAEGSIDVAEIHATAFEELTQLAKQSLSLGRGVGVILWGEPGIGKSHLLARFSRWAETDQRGYYFFLHNLQVSPDRLPRYVLKLVIHELTLGEDGEMFGGPLYTLMNRIAHMALVKLKRDILKERTPATIRRDIMQFLQIRGVLETIDDEDIYSVFIEYFLSLLKVRQRHNGADAAKAALDWLSGEPLAAHDAYKLGILTRGSALEASLPDDQAISRVLIAISNLAKLTGRSFTLCFDQVENLQETQMHALAQFTHGLIDHARNLLVVTSGAQRDLLEYKQEVIRSSSWDRIAQHQIGLTRIDTQMARKLLVARLKPFLRFEPMMSSPHWQWFCGQLFPLGAGWFHRRMNNLVEVRPRDVVSWARIRWTEARDAIAAGGGNAWLTQLKNEHVESPLADETTSDTYDYVGNNRAAAAAIDQVIRQRLENHYRELSQQTSAAPNEELPTLVESLLQQCLNAAWSYDLVDIDHPSGRGNQQPPYHFVATRRTADSEQTIGFAFFITGSKTASSGVLRRIAAVKNPPDLVYLVSEQEHPLTIGERGRKHIRNIQASGEPIYEELSHQQHCQLKAMIAVIGDAQAGDLHAAGAYKRRIEPGDVIESFHRADEYRQIPFLAMILGERRAALQHELPTRQKKSPTLCTSSLRRFIMARLALAGWMSTTELATAYVRDHGMHEEWSVETIRPLIENAALELQAEKKLEKSEKGMQLTLELASK